MRDNQFPILYVPGTVRRALAYETPQHTPQSVQELPARLPMGDLQPDTFKKTPEGFEVHYRSGDFSMKMDMNNGSFYAKEFYKNTELLYYIGVATKFLGPMMGHLRIGPTEEADKLIGSSLSEIGNIKYAPFGDVMKTGTSNFFPDGFLMLLVIPLAINSTTFQQLSKFFRNLPDDGLTLNGFMDFSLQVVNYRVGRCNDVPADDPMMLYLWNLERGYLPVAMPRLEGTPDNQAMTVRRMGYNLVLNVFMRDMFQVVQRLKDARLIGSVQETNQEETTLVANHYTVLGAKDLSFYTRDQSRRIFYPELMSDKIDVKTPALSHAEFEHQLGTILLRHQKIVQEFKSRLDKAISEATHSTRTPPGKDYRR